MAKPRRELENAVKAFRTADDPLDALAATRRMREALETIERDLVDAARADGASWSAIGKAAALTKQGAQQRFKRSAPSRRSRD